jgi:prophage DNA circulation protein
MTIVAIEAMAIASHAGLALATIQYALLRRLTLPDPPLGALASNSRRVYDLMAPTMEQASDAAAIVKLLAGDAGIIARTIATAASDAGGALSTPNDAAAQFYRAAGDITIALPAIVSPARGRAAGLARMMCGAMEASYLGRAYCLEAQSDFADRQSALDARGRIAAAMDAASDRIAQTIGGTVFDLLQATASYATDFIVALAGDLRPVVIVDAGRSFPATALAYGLYGNPARADELVARNKTLTPLFMPAQFEALAPGSRD